VLKWSVSRGRSQQTPRLMVQVKEVIAKHKPKLVVFDCNPREDVVRAIMSIAVEQQIPSESSASRQAQHGIG